MFSSKSSDGKSLERKEHLSKKQQNSESQQQIILEQLHHYVEKESRKGIDDGTTKKIREVKKSHIPKPESSQRFSPLTPIDRIKDQLSQNPDGKKKIHMQQHKLVTDPETNPDKKLGFETDTMDKSEKIVSPGHGGLPKGVAQKLEHIKSYATTHNFLTASRYKGMWNKATQCMDGYGSYTFPDGSVYRGYFSEGHFNGYGTLHLASPYNFNFKGTFVNGLLHEIEEMWFDDGLQVHVTFDKWSADFSRWGYCTPKDRRFATEQVEGLPAVGPHSFLTNSKEPRPLGSKQYDVDDGFYIPTSGLILNRTPPFPNLLVPCKDEVEWIIKNCRHGPDIKEDIPDATYHSVIDNNLENELLMQEHEPGCNFNQALYHKRYFGNLCAEFARDHLGARISDESLGYRSPATSPECESFSSSAPLLDVEDIVETARHFGYKQRGRDLEKDMSTIVTDAAKHSLSRTSTIAFGK